MITTPDKNDPAAETRSPAAPAGWPGPGVAGPFALMAGAVLAAVGMALHLPAMAEDEGLVRAIAEDLSQWLASHLLMSFGMGLVAIGAATAVRLVRGRGGRLVQVGAVTTSLGALTLALSDMAHGAVSFAVVERVDAAASLQIHEAYFSHPAILALNVGPLVLPLGMLILGAGLLRSRVAPRWSGVAIMLSPIAIHAGFSLGFPTYLHGVPLVIGMTTLGYLLSSRHVAQSPLETQKT